MNPMANLLAAQGRGGDSQLVHMSPAEIAAMQSMAQRAGTSMSVNPVTGLPEAFKLKDLFNINTYTKPVKNVMESVGLGGLYQAGSDAAKFAGQNAQYILPFIPGAAFSSVGLGALANPMGRGVLGGIAGTFGGGGRPNLKRGLMTGLTTYGLSSAYEGLQSAGGGTGAALEPIERAATGLELPPGAAADEVMKQTIAPPPVRTEFEAASQGVKNLLSSDKTAAEAAREAFGKDFGMGKGYATMMGITGTMDLDAQEKQLEADRAAGRVSEQQYQAMRARIAAAKRSAVEAMRAHPYKFATGGVPLAMKATPDTETNPYGLKRGGQARFIDGPGDGMSDSVPATIGGTQPARLADGEFVIPADVVSHLGNGSTKAGAQQLYAMMDRVRKARTGTKRQGKEIKPSKYMPV